MAKKKNKNSEFQTVSTILHKDKVARLRQVAKAERRTISNWLRGLIEDALEGK